MECSWGCFQIAICLIQVVRKLPIQNFLILLYGAALLPHFSVSIYSVSLLGIFPVHTHCPLRISPCPYMILGTIHPPASGPALDGCTLAQVLGSVLLDPVLPHTPIPGTWGSSDYVVHPFKHSLYLPS